MRRRSMVASAGAFAGIIATSRFRLLRAEFSVGMGNVEEATREASARFNDALSSFHLMLAALDRREIEAAAKYRDAAMGQFQEAANLYEKAGSVADGHTLQPRPTNEREKSDIVYFETHAAAFDVKEPLSQRDLILATSKLVRTFQERVKAQELKFLVSSLRGQQLLVNSAVELQAFLNSATTVLTLG